MRNIVQELQEELIYINKTIEDIEWGTVSCSRGYYETPQTIIAKGPSFDLVLHEVFEGVECDNGHGSQKLEGTIVFNDGTWLSRGEYDGSEWWEYNKCPTMPEELKDLL